MSEPRLPRYILGVAGAAVVVAAVTWAVRDKPDTAPAVASVASAPAAAPAPKVDPVVAQFHKDVEPILRARCYDCHGDGSRKGEVAFDDLTAEHIAGDPKFWLKVLKNTRSQVMPPPDAENPLTASEMTTLSNWITTSAFGLDPARPDPGRVTVHRLNRTEYTNTIRDLLEVEYDAESEFPGDDSGYGFENIADVLNMSPLLMEKYLTAAQTAVDRGVPKVSRVPKVEVVGPADFKLPDGTPATPKVIRGSGLGIHAIQAVAMPYIQEASINHTFKIEKAGQYRVVVEQNFRGDFAFVPQRAEMITVIDGKEVSKHTHGWISNQNVDEPHLVQWEPGEHTINISLKPIAMEGTKPRNATDNIYHIKKVRLEGPLAPSEWVPPSNYARYFSRDTPPTDAAERRAYAQEVLTAFATKAYRRPASAESVAQVVDIAEKYYSLPGNTFESGIAQGMVAILASPRFLFRVSIPEVSNTPAEYANVDEYTLASRLSYFLWSTMPDAELLKLAGEGKLRANLAAQTKRMMDDPRSQQFIEHFTGQWLQSRLVSHVQLNPREILLRENNTTRFNLTDPLREAVKQEPEKFFEHVVRDNRSIDEFLNSDYTFLNEALANLYKIEGVKGPEMRKVALPEGSERGGLITMGGVLMVTSNPTRTSPVKRGKWILDNILDAPMPPPPPDVPPLEESETKAADHVATLRETLQRHREEPICASCHNRMDPLGLALDSFNALGQWRTQEFGQPIDASGSLNTGETFADVRELKKVLQENHKYEFYRCLTEKLMIYATGRGMEYYDVPTVDKIVAELKQTNGSFSTLLSGVINSAPFQQQRLNTNPVSSATASGPRVTQTAP